MAAATVFYLLALIKGDIDEEEYLLLIGENDGTYMKQRNFPYEEYRRSRCDIRCSDIRCVCQTPY
jgi:hypothetical protein